MRLAPHSGDLSLTPSPLILRSRVLVVEAGEGSRTLVSSLEGYGSTVELHPRIANDEIQMTNVEGRRPRH